MFDLDWFKSECCAAAAGGAAQQAIREILARAVEDSGAVLKALGEPRRAGVQTLHRSTDLTILNVIWGRWVPGEPSGRIEAAGTKALSERDVLPLGRDIIHSVTNPLGRLTGAIHVYGGDFFGVPRSEWEPERLVEQPGDVQRTLQLFEESNRLYAAWP